MCINPTDEQVAELRSLGRSSGRTPDICKQREDGCLIVHLGHGQLLEIAPDGRRRYDQRITL